MAEFKASDDPHLGSLVHHIVSETKELADAIHTHIGAHHAQTYHVPHEMMERLARVLFTSGTLVSKMYVENEELVDGLKKLQEKYTRASEM